MAFRIKTPPKATMFMTKVEVPTATICVFQSVDTKRTYDVEQIFGCMVRQEPNGQRKDDLLRCQVTLKWAYTCNATLERASTSMGISGKHSVIFEFGFTSMTDLNNFVKDLEINCG